MCGGKDRYLQIERKAGKLFIFAFTMFEHRSQPLLTRRRFIWRVLRYIFFSGSIILFSLFIGMLGYRYVAHISWVDAFYNASMILTGMGPGLDIGALPEACQNSVKIFAGVYAIYSGVVFLAASGLLLTPVLHRFFHKMHLDLID
jgi:hypothetical protein